MAFSSSRWSSGGINVVCMPVVHLVPVLWCGHQKLSTVDHPYVGSLSLSTRVLSSSHSFLGPSQCRGAIRSGMSCFRCLSLFHASRSEASVTARAEAASVARPRLGGTRAGGPQSLVLASHSPKASFHACVAENLPFPTCCLLKSLEWEKAAFVAKSPSAARINPMSNPTLSESSLLIGRERSLKSSASIINVRCDEGAGSLRINPAGRLCRAFRTFWISAPRHPTFCILMYAVPSWRLVLPL